MIAVPAAESQSEATAPGEYPAEDFEFEDPVACGTDFFGRIVGGIPPYTLEYDLVGPPDFALGSFSVPTEGIFSSPPGFTAGVPFGTYEVTVTATDDVNQFITKVFTGTISEFCGPPPMFDDPIVCGGDFFGSITGGTPPYTLVYELSGPATISLGSYQLTSPGPFRSPPGFTAGVPFDTYDVTVELTDAVGRMLTKSFSGTISAICGGGAVGGAGGDLPTDPILQAIQDRLRAEAEARAAAAAAAQQVRPAQPIAVTGSSTNVPLAVAFALIGTGGLALFAARKRQDDQDDQGDI